MNAKPDDKSPAKAWIVSADFKSCPYCPGAKGKFKAKIEVEADGKIRRFCPQCGRRDMARATKYRDVRACQDCGHHRPVSVYLSSWTMVHATFSAPAVKEGGQIETWEPHCSTCKLRRAARTHELAATSLRQKADDIELKRALLAKH